MRKHRLLLAALIFSISGWVSAEVPVIKLAESQRVETNFYSLLALNNYIFGTTNSTKAVETIAYNGMHGLQSSPVSPKAFSVFSGLLTQVGNISNLTNHQVSEGSFSSYANEASSSNIRPVSDAGPRRYGVASPAPKSWAVLLLVLGCVFYQGRRRQRSLGFQKQD